ncbi:aminopeptidase [Haladaptatus sp. CMSO5]|uniref:aminopeptidase n=1 Tax=Haladaptatus sp. CMSO5 TaxID=3120514 RepID=UPI002FCDEAAF
MDSRIREHAEVIVSHSTEIERGDNVIVSGSPESEALLVAIAERCGEIGATAITRMASYRAQRAYKRAIDPEDIEEDEMTRAQFEAADVLILVRAPSNMTAQSDVPPEVNQRKAQADKAVREAYLDTQWVITQYPTAAGAQKAEMSTDAYESFVWDAINRNWDAQRTHQQQLADILDDGESVRIRAGERTDLTMSIAGNGALNDHGEHNMPGGEVATVPVCDSVEGEVLFDLPVLVQGRELTDVWLRFEAGVVVEHAAEKNEEVLDSLLETDEGARRLGELGIGMNRDIDQFTYNMLFDEKMGDTIHLALGQALAECVGAENAFNDSVVHTDMLVDMSEDAVLEIDGEVVQRDGVFRWEDGFEG